MREKRPHHTTIVHRKIGNGYLSVTGTLLVVLRSSVGTISINWSVMFKGSIAISKIAGPGSNPGRPAQIIDNDGRESSPVKFAEI